MKHSGIPWLGEIPEEWAVGPVKQFYSFTTGFTPPSKNDSYYDVDGVPWITIGDLKGRFITGSDKGISKQYITDNNLRVVPAGSLLYSFKLSVGQVAITKIDVFTNEAIAAFFDGKDVDLDFLQYSSQVCIVMNANENIYGAKLLNQELINNALIVFPPLQDQKLIASFLNQKCQHIDDTIELEESCINELRVYKQTIITEAVSKGLNAEAPKKDTGIPWLGEIPKEWNIVPLKYVLTRRNEKNSPIKSTERLSLSIDVGVTRYEDKTTNLDRFKDDFEQYQLAYPDDIVLNSMNMIVGAVGKSSFFGCVSPVYYVMTPNAPNNPSFLGYLLNTVTIRRLYHSLGKGIYAIERGDGRVNTCRLKVPFYDFGRIEIPVPPIEEQQAIADYLDTKCSEIDSLIALKQSKIEALKEYKKSIIYEYVTGKKEVVE